ncbi:MAG: hypothetical protein J7J46_00275 [Candidatus Desulfofervidus sp.]|nr:hypothetical protein [Candidatus Desulfofervidus sp.]
MNEVIIITDHSSYDYQWILENSNLIIDTRDAINSPNKEKVILDNKRNQNNWRN